MKILLLGGEGFIGRNIIDVLDERFNCYSLGRTPSNFRTSFDRFIRMDPYRETINESFDVIVHLIDNKSDLNLEIDFLKKINSDAHIILFSSAVVYANPTSEYGVRKSNLEKIYLAHHKKLTILRLFNVYGKYQIPYRQGSLVANILYNHINNIPIRINDVNVKRDFIFAEDIGRYVEFVISNGLYGIYDLATGKMHSIQELCRIIQDVVACKLNIVDSEKNDITCPPSSKMIPCNIGPTELSCGIKDTLLFFEDNNTLITRSIP
jgi:nucleoside-diphosphate-sugar epimerase